MKYIIILLLFTNLCYTQNDSSLTVLKSSDLIRLDERTNKQVKISSKIKLIIDYETSYATFYTYEHDELIVFKIIDYDKADDGALLYGCKEKATNKDLLITVSFKEGYFHLGYREDPYIYIYRF